MDTLAKINHVVVASVRELALQVPLAVLLHGDMLAIVGGAAVNDNLVYAPHGYHISS